MRAEHSGRGIAIGAALAASLVCASPALAGPRGGARYDGRDATHKRAFVAVSKNARSVKAFGFATRTGTCSDHKRHAVIFALARARTRILPNGSFGKAVAAGRSRARVSGQFNASGDTVTGIYNIALRTRRYRCRTGDVNYSLHRDGTRGAPYRNARTASGLYTGSGRGVRLSLRALVPGGLIHSFRVAYSTRCSSGKPQPWALRLVVPLLKGSRFAAVVRDRHRRKSGGSDSTNAQIAGKFVYARGYKLAGAIKARNVIRKPGKKPIVCKATIPFTGRFIRGPLGEEGPHPAR
jgi:hypothetical protein